MTLATKEWVISLLKKVIKSSLQTPYALFVAGQSAHGANEANVSYTATDDETLLCFTCASSSNYDSIVHTLVSDLQTTGSIIYNSGFLNPSNITGSTYGSVAQTWVINVKKGDTITMKANVPRAGSSQNCCVGIISTNFTMPADRIKFLGFSHDANRTTNTFKDIPNKKCYYINFAYGQLGEGNIGTVYENCPNGAGQIMKQTNTYLPRATGGNTSIAIGTYKGKAGLEATFTSVNSNDSGSRHNHFLYKFEMD